MQVLVRGPASTFRVILRSLYENGSETIVILFDETNAYGIRKYVRTDVAAMRLLLPPPPPIVHYARVISVVLKINTFSSRKRNEMLRRTGMSEYHPRLVSSHLPAVQRVPVGQTSHRHPIYPVYEEKSVAGKRRTRLETALISVRSRRVSKCLHSVDSVSPGELTKKKNKYIVNTIRPFVRIDGEIFLPTTAE